MTAIKNVLVTGGAGYVGAVLIPKLLYNGYKVKVLDLFMYGDDAMDAVKDNPNLELVKGDIRDRALLEKTIPGTDAVIHLACISNDPSFELNPALGKSINFDAFLDLVDVCHDAKIQRFIFASSSSVYGIKQEENVTEDLSLEPLTDYSKYKVLCEDVLQRVKSLDFPWVVIRPATVCGYSPRLRLDLAVNILTSLAINTGKITVFGGDQRRPNIHIEDVTDVYVKLLELPTEKINGKIFNVGFENHRIAELADMVQSVVGKEGVEIVTTPSDDNRSYHVSSGKIEKELGFKPKHTVEDAIRDLKQAFDDGKIPDPINDIRYYNIKTMQAKNFK